ncbi:MAG: response regulator transcription factor [Bacteroidetes bacterium]|nr:response regulator transcription factor [Bacteroidota bacterium]
MKATPYTILVAEPNDDWYDKIKQSLQKRNHEVFRVKSSNDVLDQCNKHNPDLLILEHDLNPVDGVEVAIEIRDDQTFRKLPIVFLSETIDKYTQIAAYEAGADMYIKKGTKSRLFLSIIAAVLRRVYEMNDTPSMVQKFGEIEIDEEQIMVYKKGKALDLSKKEFQILLLLASKPGKVFRRPNILKKIWGDDVIVGDRNIDTHIKKLRKKLGKEYIQTSRGMGYKFNVK